MTAAAFAAVRDETALGPVLAELERRRRRNPIVTARLLAEMRKHVQEAKLPDRVVEAIADALRRLGTAQVQVTATLLDDGVPAGRAPLVSEWVDASPAVVVNSVHRCWVRLFSGEAFYAARARVPERIEVRVEPEGAGAGTSAAAEGMAARAPAAGHAAVALQESLDDVYALDLGLCEPVFVRALQKKVWLRTACREAGIPVWNAWYIVHDEGSLRGDVATLLARFRTVWAHVQWGPSVGQLMVRLEDVPRVLAERLPSIAGPRGHGCAVIAEVLHPAKAEGCAGVLADGGVFVEAFPSGVNQKTGSYAPARYVLNRDDAIVEERPQVFSVAAVLESATFTGEHGWAEVDVTPYELRLSEDEVAQIARSTRKLAELFPGIRVEWTSWNGEIFVQDCSFEAHEIALPFAATGQTVLSPGEATGRVLKVDDLASYERMVSARSIGLMSYDERQDEAHLDEQVERVRRLASEGDVVLVSDYPSVGLLPLVPYCAAFVFERGNLLCHTAISMREHGRPGVVAPGVTSELVDGEEIYVSSCSGIKRLAAMEQ